MGGSEGTGARRSAPLLTSIAYTVRTEGLGWVLRRLRYRTPATAPGRAVHAFLRRGLGAVLMPARRLRRSVEGAFPLSADALYAFYDLQVAPITFDASWFAAGAELERRRQGLRHIHFVVVPGKKDGLREERVAYEAAVDTPSRLWRLHNIVIPVLTLVPTWAGYTVLPSRETAATVRASTGKHVYPHHYEPVLPVGCHPSEILAAAREGAREMGVLRSPLQGLRFVERWATPRLRGRRLVTITLREHLFMAGRNSNLEVWTAFARRLDARRYFPVFVLDSERALDPVPAPLAELEIFREASWNAGLRMALYESSYLNLGVNNGPLFMCAMNARTRLLVFKIITPSVPQATEAFLRELGFDIGGQLPFATQFQRLVWEDDTLEVIEREFEAMVSRIEAGRGAS